MYASYALAIARQDGMQRAAATYRLTNQARKARATRRQDAMAAPVRRLARLRPHKLPAS